MWNKTKIKRAATIEAWLQEGTLDGHEISSKKNLIWDLWIKLFAANVNAFCNLGIMTLRQFNNFH